jgi:hypothetical protein
VESLVSVKAKDMDKFCLSVDKSMGSVEKVVMVGRSFTPVANRRLGVARYGRAVLHPPVLDDLPS